MDEDRYVDEGAVSWLTQRSTDELQEYRARGVGLPFVQVGDQALYDVAVIDKAIAGE